MRDVSKVRGLLRPAKTWLYGNKSYYKQYIDGPVCKRTKWPLQNDLIEQGNKQLLFHSISKTFYSDVYSCNDLSKNFSTLGLTVAS